MKPRPPVLPELDPIYQPDRADLAAFVAVAVVVLALVAAKVWL